MGRFQSRDTFSSWRSTLNTNTVIGWNKMFIIGVEIMFDSIYVQGDEICSLPQSIKGQYS